MSGRVRGGADLASAVPPPYRAPPRPAASTSIRSAFNISEPDVTRSGGHATPWVSSGPPAQVGSTANPLPQGRRTLDETARGAALNHLRESGFRRAPAPAGMPGSKSPGAAFYRDASERLSVGALNSAMAAAKTAPPKVPPKPRPAAASSGMPQPDDNGLFSSTLISKEPGPVGRRSALGHGCSTPPLPALSPSPGPIFAGLPSGAALDLETLLREATGRPGRTRVSGEALNGHDELDQDGAEEDDEDPAADDDSSVVGGADMVRKQLDGLETMYAEVLRLLGRRGFPAAPLRASTGSLPSVSSVGSRHLRRDRRRAAEAKAKSGLDRRQDKRFRRLESHVVTLARSVAHLSSEMRSQSALIREMDRLRADVESLRVSGVQQQAVTVGPANTTAAVTGPVLSAASALQANRVKKLTKFFGDEPPLLRLFLKNLGYEKYASLFEEAKIGMLELPFVSEDRLEKLGIPLGPRARILHECRPQPAAATGAFHGGGQTWRPKVNGHLTPAVYIL